MFRLPLLANAQSPEGRLQPSAAIGPAVGLAFTSVDFRPSVFDKVDEDGHVLGLDLRTGLAWQWNRRIAIFGEYRFTSLDLDVTTEEEEAMLSAILALAARTSRVTGSLKTQRLLLGLSYRF